MPQFLGLARGEERTAPGIRVRISDDGERVWMHGKWLDLGPDHAVAWIEGAATFVRPDGKELRPGQFPAWVVRGAGKRPAMAMMFNAGQFRGGHAEVKSAHGKVVQFTME